MTDSFENHPSNQQVPRTIEMSNEATPEKATTETAPPSCAPSNCSETFTRYHLCQSVRGPLTNWTARDWKKATKWITKADGSKYEPFELKQAFLDELAKGHEVIPICECDNFDWKEGCKGHRMQSPNDQVH